VLKNLLIESQRLYNALMLDARERFGENVHELLVRRNVLDAECTFLVMISNEMIPDVDVLRSLIIRLAFDD
jgi:hypothetical protein